MVEEMNEDIDIFDGFKEVSDGDLIFWISNCGIGHLRERGIV
jgi:hypothetical protein